MPESELEKLARIRALAQRGEVREFLEEYCYIRDETGNLVPFKFRRPQEMMYAEWLKGSHLYSEVKPRKAYSTSFWVSLAWARAATTPLFQCLILADDKETVEGILKITDTLDAHCYPLARRPKSVWDKEHRGYIFGIPKAGAEAKPVWERSINDYNSPMESSIITASARNYTIGRGMSPNMIIKSEYAYYGERQQDLETALSNAGGRDAVTIEESTPNGTDNLHYTHYHAIKEGRIPGRTIFYPHWWKEEDALPLGDSSRLSIKPIEKFTEEEAYVIERMKADSVPQEELEPRIAWRRFKIAESTERYYGDEEKGRFYFLQEHPEDDVSCWVSIENAAFQRADLERMMRDVRPPTLTLDKNVNLPVGFRAFMWQKPRLGAKYVAFQDTAAGVVDGDFTVTWIADMQTGMFVCKLKGRTSVDEATLASLEMCKIYNNALYVPEINGLGAVIPSILAKQDYQHYFKERGKGPNSRTKVGWSTSQSSKMAMYESAIRLIHREDVICYDKETVEQLMKWQQFEDKSYGVKPPAHDDDAIAFMGCCFFIQERPALAMARSVAPIVPVSRSNQFWPG